LIGVNYELVCVDVFQTLVDINTRIPFIWRRILKDKYNDTLAFECAKSVMEENYENTYI